ncbi:MAG: histidine kinase [Gammaproteobacteria bacterium]|nr:MAG: histidine kinase [Gammaproteobacteria bacterium]
MRSLSLCDVEQVDELAWPENYQEITLNSPALLVLTDFKKHKPLVIDEDVSAHDTEQLMMHAHVRLKIVVDKDNKFLGVVSLMDINHQEIMKKVAAGYKHDDLLVTDFMQPKSALKAIDFNDLKNAHVGDILETLKTNGERHCLVINREKHNIRGVVSASNLVRTLKLEFDLSYPPSFVEIFNLIHA